MRGSSVPLGWTPAIRGFAPTGRSVYKHTARPAAGDNPEVVRLEVRGQWAQGRRRRRTASATHASCGLAGRATRPRPPDCRAPRGTHVVPRGGGAPLPHGVRSAPWWRLAASSAHAQRRRARRLPVSRLSMHAVARPTRGEGTVVRGHVCGGGCGVGGAPEKALPCRGGREEQKKHTGSSQRESYSV